jgi:hypothetical protein
MGSSFCRAAGSWSPFAWARRFRHLVKGYERYAYTLEGLHVVAFACIMMNQAANFTTDA